MSGDQKPFNSLKNLSEQLDVEFALQATGLGVWELDTNISQLVWDDRCRELFGLAKHNHLPYEEATRYIHPDDLERVNQAVFWAANPQSGGHYDETYRTIGADDGKLRWVRFYGRAYFNESGKLYRFAGVAHEVTGQINAQEREATARHLVQRQQRILEAISASTPDLMYVFDLNYCFTYANQALLDMWDSTWEQSIGKNLLEIGYEPWHAEMHEREIDQVVATKRSIRGEVSFPHATLGRRVYDYVFAPVLNEQGEVEAIAGTTRDITELIHARQVLEEKETALSNAIEVAGLGTWSVNIPAGLISVSLRVADWFGFDHLTVDMETFLAGIGEEDRGQVRNSLYHLPGGADRKYDQVYCIINAQNGRKRIAHAIGRVYFDAAGEPVKIVGSVQDITVDRELTLYLEQQVQERTEELAAMNERLTASNQELEQANGLLVRSNDNLQNFAYVASHDLQEPLRKIQQFGNLLRTRHTTLTDEELVYVERMQSAASRMTILIRDLLDFSSISRQREMESSVPLSAVVDQVLTTLELVVAETHAQVIVGPLPEVKGEVSQLSQLFQNLIGNALKFHKPGVAPVIHIQAQQVEAGHLPASVKPLRAAKSYQRIDVSDNGIGFDERYLDRIFQVFQRLHNKSQFSGTGIGLAICERVVANHGGAITASSQPGVGTTFTGFLPA